MPNLNFIGTDGFNYSALNALSESDTATVTINIKNGVSINDASVIEGNRGTVNDVFTVSFTAPIGEKVEIGFTTIPTTATPGADYVTTTGSLIFLPGGPTQQTIAVPVIGDRLFEGLASEGFFVELFSSSNVFIFDKLGLGRILDDDLPVGTNALVPSDATVQVGEGLNLSLTWTHPEQWRLLDSIDLLLVDEEDEGEVLGVRWQEFDDTFSLFSPAAGRFIRTAPAGSLARFETAAATLYPPQSRSHGSGPSGHDVTIDYYLSFKPKSAGKTFRIEAFATDDFGSQQGFEPVGTVTVLQR